MAVLGAYFTVGGKWALAFVSYAIGLVGVAIAAVLLYR
jgi:hypothetical protein